MTKQQRDTFEGHIEQAMRDAKTSSPDALVTGVNVEKHTPLPWQLGQKSLNIYGPSGRHIVDTRPTQWPGEDKANGAFIVHAVNSIDTLTRQRDALLEACKAIDQAYGIQTYSERVNAMRKGWQLIRSAIALAEKEGK